VIRDVASWTTQDTPLRASGSQPPDLRWQLMNVWFCLAGGQPTGDPTSVSTTMPTAIGRLPSGPREVARTAAAWAADRRVGYRSVPFTRRPGYCTVTMKTLITGSHQLRLRALRTRARIGSLPEVVAVTMERIGDGFRQLGGSLPATTHTDGVGQGRTLFKDGVQRIDLELVGTTVIPPGVALLTYQSQP
jgi:hypothetical protein